MLCSDFSIRLMISRSTDSGDAPGYGIDTTITGCSTSGIWFTRSFFSASRPSAISPMMMTTVEIGRLMLKSESSMIASLLGRRQRIGRDRCLAARLDRLLVLQERGRIADHLVALGEAALQHVVAGARIALAESEAHLLQLVLVHPP